MGTLVGTCIDCEEERRKNGMEEGVKRFDGLRRTDEVGLSGPGCGGDSAEVVLLVLALESVPVRLATGPRSGVLLDFVDDGGRSPGLRIEPTEDSDPREAAEDMAAGCSQGCLGGTGDSVWSLEVDLRNW